MIRDGCDGFEDRRWATEWATRPFTTGGGTILSRMDERIVKWIGWCEGSIQNDVLTMHLHRHVGTEFLSAADFDVVAEACGKGRQHEWHVQAGGELLG